MSSAFISYSRRDSQLALFIANTLINHGFNVFIDTEHMDAGNFISNIGNAIKQNRYFVILISPNSVNSKWVQREAGLAFSRKDDKDIIPIILRETPIEGVMWPLELIEQVDFTEWYTHQDMSESLTKIGRLMGFSYIKESVAEKPTLSDETFSELIEDERPVPEFSRSDVTELLIAAASQQKSNPERAVYLYNQVIEISPDYLDGTAKAFINRQTEIVNPIRVHNLTNNAKEAFTTGQWHKLANLCTEILKIDDENGFAKQHLIIAKQNQECESIYRLAEIAKKREDFEAIITFFEDIQQNCPHYGDPSHTLAGYPIIRSLVSYIRPSLKIEEHTGITRCATFSPNGQFLASGGDDKVIRLWHIPHGEEYASLEANYETVNSLSFSPDGLLVASASDDGTVRLWDVTSRKLIKSMSNGGAVYSVVFSHGGTYIASSSADKTIWIWKTEDFTLIRRLEGHTGYVRAIEFSPDDSVLVSTSSDRTVRMWDTSDWNEIVKPLMLKEKDRQHSGDIYDISFSQDGNIFASADNSGVVKIWETSSGKQAMSLANNSTIATFSPYDNYLLASSKNRDIVLWNIQTRQKLRTFKGHDDYINSISFSPDGEFMATTSRDWMIKLWALD